MSEMAKRAERELNSYQAKQGVGQKSTSSMSRPISTESCLYPRNLGERKLTNSSAEEAGVNADVGRRFPGAEVKYGSEVTTGASDNKPIPEDEGGVRDDRGK